MSEIFIQIGYFFESYARKQKWVFFSEHIVCILYRLKSQIAHSDMHHPVSGINSLIHSVSLASRQSCLDSPPHSLVSSSLLSLPLSSIIIHPSLFHSRLKTFSTNPYHLRLLSPTGLHDNGSGPDLSCSSFYVSFKFYFFLFRVVELS